MADRFLSKIDFSGDCWLWCGAVDPNGYGAFRYGGRKVGAHRVAYERWFGPIPPREPGSPRAEETVVHHECHNRRCLRHLALLTRAENAAIQRRSSC